MATRRNSVSDLDANIKQQTDKLKKLKEKKKRLLEADNIRLGKLVRKVFKNQLPESPDEQKLFFDRLAKSLEVGDNKNDNMSHSDTRTSEPVRPQTVPESGPVGAASYQQPVQPSNVQVTGSPSESNGFGG